MMRPTIEIPDHLNSFLIVENCKDFNETRYYKTNVLEELIDEILKMEGYKKELKNYNINYLNSVLLYGPTGTGKTTMAEYIAYKLELDLVYVNFAGLIDGIMGNTTKNISDIFRFMMDKRCIFMLDEIDCISQERGTESEATGGELSRITITLMQEISRYKKRQGQAILFAATNRLDILDDALVSRFAIRKKIDYLNNPNKVSYITQYLSAIGIEYDIQNIRNYCNMNPQIPNRDIETDMERCIIEWIKNGKQDYILNRIIDNNT